jgi:putative nucleotidyltransferase with HDIG domain
MFTMGAVFVLPEKKQDKLVEQKKHIHCLEEKVNVLTEKLLEAFEELNIFYDVSQTLSNVYDVTDICNIALNQIVEIVRSEKASVAMVDEENQDYLTIISSYGFSGNPIGHKIKIKNSIYNEVIINKKPFLDNNQKRKVRAARKKYKYKTKYCVLQPLCSMPMGNKEEIIGVISLSDKVDKQSFTARDLKFLSAIATQTAIVIQNARLVNNLKESFITTVRALSAAIDAKDHYTQGHSERVNEYALNIGRILGISESDLEKLELACLLHDVGKIGISENILNKKGKLTAKERDIIQQHPLKGIEILNSSKQVKSVIAAVRHHHERYDGCGYPDGLIGEQIPLLARIIAVADTFDAMVSDRPYRSGCSQKIAIEEIRRGAGSQFDSKVVWAFLKWIKRRKKRAKSFHTPTIGTLSSI